MGQVTVPHKNIISNVTKNEEAGLDPVPLESFQLKKLQTDSRKCLTELE